MKNYIKGYIYRSENSDEIRISTGSETPSKNAIGCYKHISRCFYAMSVRTFKRYFGFSIKPGTYEPVNISISRKEV